MFDTFLIKYGEIGVKGKNRYMFEEALVHQIELALRKIDGKFRCSRESGRIYVYCMDDFDYDETVDALQHVFGIVGICQNSAMRFQMQSYSDYSRLLKIFRKISSIFTLV